MRTVRTGSGATAVQIVHSSRRGSRDIEHVGSAMPALSWRVLKAVAAAAGAGQAELDLGLEATEPTRRGERWGRCRSTSSRMGLLLDAVEHGYRVLGIEQATDGDEVFRRLEIARIIEPLSKLDSLRVLEEASAAAASHRTVTCRLPLCAKEPWRQKLSGFARRTRDWAGRACISRPTPGTGSASLGSPRSAGWRPRSLSACLPTRAASR